MNQMQTCLYHFLPVHICGQYDHELTKKGIEQAADFNRRWKAVKENTPEDEDLKLFLSAQKIFASPLLSYSITDAAVSSHVLSIPKTFSLLIIFPLY